MMNLRHPSSAYLLENQYCARHQQQHEHHLPECGLVEIAVKLHAEPGAGEQHRESDQEKPDGVCRDRTFGTEPCSTHGKDRNSDGLEDRALLVLRPAAQAAPDCDENAGKASDAGILVTIW